MQSIAISCWTMRLDLCRTSGALTMPALWSSSSHPLCQLYTTASCATLPANTSTSSPLLPWVSLLNNSQVLVISHSCLNITNSDQDAHEYCRCIVRRAFKGTRQESVVPRPLLKVSPTDLLSLICRHRDSCCVIDEDLPEREVSHLPSRLVCHPGAVGHRARLACPHPVWQSLPDEERLHSGRLHGPCLPGRPSKH